jgi:hypothetical protein
MTNPLDNYADFYDAATDSYDLDAYAEAVTLDRIGMYTPAYRALVEGDIALMQAYNDDSGHDTADRARAWLARFTNGAGLPVVTLLWFGAMVLAVGLLG